MGNTDSIYSQIYSLSVTTKQFRCFYFIHFYRWWNYLNCIILSKNIENFNLWYKIWYSTYFWDLKWLSILDYFVEVIVKWYPYFTKGVILNSMRILHIQKSTSFTFFGRNGFFHFFIFMLYCIFNHFYIRTKITS